MAPRARTAARLTAARPAAGGGLASAGDRRRPDRGAAAALAAALLLVRAALGPAPAQAASGGHPLTPAGALIRDAATHEPAVAPLPVAFVRTPDASGPGGRGRYLVAVNSGFGVQFSAATNRAQQSLTVIDLGQSPPTAVQTVYFPTPQSANVGAVFGAGPDARGQWPLYVSGGFENKIWVFAFRPGNAEPLSPPSPGPATQVTAAAIDLSALAAAGASKTYNDGRPPVYPAGLAIAPDGSALYAANNLADTLTIVADPGGAPKVSAVPLGRAGREGELLPYAVAVVPDRAGKADKAFVSLWGAGAVAVVRPGGREPRVTRIAVGGHPTAMLLNRAGSRLYVADSNADAVSVIDTARDAEIERIDVRLDEHALPGVTPEDIALDDSGARLYVASAHANAVAVVELSAKARGEKPAGARRTRDGDDRPGALDDRSRVIGLIPTGEYPSAVAVAGTTLVVGNGKGTGFENSSMTANVSGLAPNAPNYRFPADPAYARGQSILSLVSGNFSAVPLPDERQLAEFTRQVLQNNGLVSAPRSTLFPGPSPITHVIYVIRENRTYDQVFGDVSVAGDGAPADGDPLLAIFGTGEAARTRGGTPQAVTPNAHALALRFGLLDRFFVNSEASPDGHNWCTAAFSTDYVDKVFRWNYSMRGRSYDFQGFNQLPDLEPPDLIPDQIAGGVDVGDVVRFYAGYVPYLHGVRDVAEPETLYLWDAAARAGLSYRSYGEFVATVTRNDVDAINAKRIKPYPDTSPVLAVLPTKRSLERHVAPAFPTFDLAIPDAMTVDSYLAATRANGVDPAIRPDNPDPRFRGTSRLGAWLAEFDEYVRDLGSGGEGMPRLSIISLCDDHTAGLKSGMPTPQMMVADNDYALGRLVEAVSHSPYWRNTAILVLEDDAQAGPDHIDAHRSPALVISAYNRRGALVRGYHSTVSLIRTIEMLLGLPPMNQLDAAAAPIDVFGESPDLEPFTAVLPHVAPDNLMVPPPADARAAYWNRRSDELNLSRPDMADPAVLNAAIWFSAKGGRGEFPAPASLPAFDLMTFGLNREDESLETRDAEVTERARREAISRLARRN